MKTPLWIALAATLLAAAACGSDDTETVASECALTDIEVTGAFGEKPTVTLPEDCSPPSELGHLDLEDGSGPTAEEGGTVLTDYHLTTWSNKAVRDSSFDRGQPFPVSPLGSASVIEGWNEGLVGMTAGTRRLLVVPPDKGYGAGGNGIEADETLVFVIDAVEVD